MSMLCLKEPNVDGLSQSPRRNLWFSRLKLGQKIGFGHAIALGIAIVGITAGFLVGDHYQHEAQAEKDDAAAELDLAQRLEIHMLAMSVDQKDSILTLQDSRLWAEEHQRFLAGRERLAKTWQEFQKEQGTLRADIDETDGEAETIKELTETYEILIENLQVLDLMFQKGSQGTVTDEERQIIHAEAVKFHNQALLGNASRFVQKLDLFVKQAEDETKVAIADLAAADRLRLSIIVGSLALSTVIASILALGISRTITQPIKSTAEVAQKVIETSNFELQASIVSQDEVGHLSGALNELIVTVKQLLQDQQEKNQSLEQALVEISTTQAALVQSEKMSSLGQMVAGVAHEINNPVNFIHGNIFHLQNYFQEILHGLNLYQENTQRLPAQVEQEIDALDLEYLSEDFNKILSSMQIGTERITEIVKSLRNFSRLDEAEFKAADIGEGIDNTLMILAHRMKACDTTPEIQVTKDYADLPPIECYAGQLNQVFMNILSNAIDAFGEINQHRAYQEIKAEPNIIHIQTRLTPDQQVVIRIRDNGPGIPPDVQQKIFDPFFTTKAVGKGTGLGLAISYQVIEKHGGHLSCQSSSDGTEFLIQIPLTQTV
jgi:signal transduction histidine kinase